MGGGFLPYLIRLQTHPMGESFWIRMRNKTNKIAHSEIFPEGIFLDLIGSLSLTKHHLGSSELCTKKSDRNFGCGKIRTKDGWVRSP